MAFIDLHAHYPMHLGLPKSASDNPIVKLPKQALFDLANEVGNFEPINKPRVTAEQILTSKVTGLASVLYDPEDEFLVAQEPHPIAIEHIRQQITDVESDASAHGIGVAKTWTELQSYINDSRPFIVHCIEGGHALAGDPDHVKELAKSGITYLILAHLRYMGLAGCAKGLPCKSDFWQNLINQDQDPAVGLSEIGFRVLEAILSSRVILDVTHCSDLSRKDIMAFYASNGSDRPLISSHSGVQYLANYELNVSDEWIKFIADTGGVIGVILFPFWLANSPKGRIGIDLVGDTIDHLRLVGGDECVGIGTDLDGFIQPINECKNYAEIPSFLEALQNRYEGQSEFLEKLLLKNALRVLRTALPQP
jgi:microsomal dipeptidase-like Zn-dependent dipeptidase